jgi:hypothetical protein
MNPELIVGAVEGVTRKWAKQRKAEEKEASRTLRRQQVMTRTDRVTIKSAAWDVMEPSYREVSGPNNRPAHARQIMYAARNDIQRTTGERLNDKYFTQTLLPDYMAEYPDRTGDWDVVFDARGHFHEPHDGEEVPLGTIEVRNYLSGLAGELKVPPVTLSVDAGSWRGPNLRFGAVLFIEKEGFMPLFRAVRLAERYDIAIMSTKGVSTTASRMLVERLCADHGIPLLLLRDFDKAGFTIAGTFRRSNRRYTYTRPMEVVDLGLRLADVREWGLSEEDVFFQGSSPVESLEVNGATAEEIDFLCGDGRIGRRVELNAFTSDALVECIEGKLKANGVSKVLPPAEVIDAAFQRAVEVEVIESRMDRLRRRAHRQAVSLGAPDGLADAIRRAVARDPSTPWYDAIRTVAAKYLAERLDSRSDE